jgi:hypothetical protein
LAETVETTLDKRAALGDPVGERVESARLDSAAADAPNFLASDKPAFLQYLEVLDNCGERHVEGFGQVADTGRPAAQPLDDCPARGLREGFEAAVDILILKNLL